MWTEGACRKFLALTARRAWWSTHRSEPERPRDPECDCREAKASIQGRLQGPAFRGVADSAGRLLYLRCPLGDQRNPSCGLRQGLRQALPGCVVRNADDPTKQPACEWAMI